ncbi:Sfi1-domain-containing protein [Didymella exigua CBS 183.55]|uniref:Sfi1-domain-containing protein n=1 Tax=Didymella exigua CBS 183.55 TaxID=1150837 RepID=A0A6A5RAH9_9PLEO|nr:Sfi1-domain-containing protein [Didymella exigua CBS 183.55]KAF1924622.1 Sfi1-domain-containing protein [Didymella exigua CBS 183.55]
MNGSGYNTPDLHKDDLSDEAIELLYTIIHRASSSPDRSSRALFNAYEEVLEEHGLLPSDDAVLHRFLFRMQKDRRRDESLVERFHRVLAEFEIVIEAEEESEGDVAFATGNIAHDGNTTNARNAARATLGHTDRLTRRGSFESFFDGTADKVAGSEVRGVSMSKRRSSLSHAPNGILPKRRSTSDTEALRLQQAHIPIRTRVNGVAQRRVSSGQYYGRQRNASISSRGSWRIRRDINTSASQQGVYEEAASEYTDRTTDLDLSRVQVPGVNAPIPDDQYDQRETHASTHYYQQFVPEPYQPSDTRLMDEAETFEHQRLHRVTRGCIQAWRNRTRDLVERRYEQEALAEAFDRRILMKVTLDQLRDTARVRRSSYETDRFFGRLESRADKARNLFLLTKAFTHWARSAEEEVQRTSVARRHILRTRFFNGWREITAINELKIQHFVLTKFLQQWRAKTATVRENAQFAVTLYEENLAQKIFTNWFFQFCAIAGSAWHNDRLKRNTLKRWIELAGINTQENESAIKKSESIVLARMLTGWRQRTTALQSLESQADEFRRTARLASGLYNLRKHAQLKPLLQQFQTRIDGGQVRTTFQVWRHTAHLSQRAQQVDKLRIMRNAYTAWNDRLRKQALEQRINDRILVECLYKWTLASRVSLFQRVQNRQIKESTFLTWVTKTNQRANTFEAAERRFANFKRAQLLRICLKKMEVDTAEKRREECAVIAEYDLKLKQRIFEKLKERLGHFQQLKQWSADARFYVLGTRTLKKWNSATQQTRRNRRRDTYAQVRRTVKTNLVHKVFESWRARANTIVEQNEQAAFILEARTLHTAGTLLHDWHDRTLAIQQLDTQASNVHTFKLGTKHVQAWTQRLDALQSMDSQAAALRQESTEIAAAGALKKLGWRLWNVQRQEETSRALFERNFEKHVRAMIRFWHDQTAERLANRPVSPTPTRSSRGGRGSPDDDHTRFNDDHGDGDEDEQVSLDNAGDETRRLEAWTAFDASALGLNDDLDLSLSITPERQRTTSYPLAPPASSPKPPSSTRPPTSRPRTFPQSASALRPPPAPEPVSPDLEFAEDERSTFWAGTPAYPPPTTSKLKGAGYLKTPSKRAVVRAKRPELPSSPEKRVVRLGAMSAPPVQMNREFGMAGGNGGTGGGAVSGVTSFQRRLREGGFGVSVGPSAAVPNSALKGARGRAVGGRGRVGFGDVSQFG